MIIKQLNESIRADKESRKEMGLVIKGKERPRQILTRLGMIGFERDYFYAKGAARHITLLDPMMGIEKRERIAGTVKVALITEATDSTYARSVDR